MTLFLHTDVLLAAMWWRCSCTFLVQPEEEEPTMARLLTLPLNTDWTELMKLDFPEPTGPRKRTRAWGTSAHLGA